MFEDQNQKVDDIFSDTDQAPAQAAPRVAAPLGPPSALSQGKLQPVQSSSQNVSLPAMQLSGVKSSFPFKKVLAISLVSLFVVGGATGAFFWWRGQGQEEAAPSLGAPVQTPVVPAQPSGPGDNNSEEPENGTGNFMGDKINETYSDLSQDAVNRALDPFASPSAPETPPSAPEGAASQVDSDQDGLSDGQEFTLGTNPRLVDSDGDGLSDWEEVSIFGSEPLKTDTDGDKYTDGEEVQNGYNPKGPGKLLDFDKAKNVTNQ